MVSRLVCPDSTTAHPGKSTSRDVELRHRRTRAAWILEILHLSSLMDPQFGFDVDSPSQPGNPPLACREAHKVATSWSAPRSKPRPRLQRRTIQRRTTPRAPLVLDAPDLPRCRDDAKHAFGGSCFSGGESSNKSPSSTPSPACAPLPTPLRGIVQERKGKRCKYAGTCECLGCRCPPDPSFQSIPSLRHAFRGPSCRVLLQQRKRRSGFLVLERPASGGPRGGRGGKPEAQRRAFVPCPAAMPASGWLRIGFHSRRDMRNPPPPPPPKGHAATTGWPLSPRLSPLTGRRSLELYSSSSADFVIPGRPQNSRTTKEKRKQDGTILPDWRSTGNCSEPPGDGCSFAHLPIVMIAGPLRDIVRDERRRPITRRCRLCWPDVPGGLSRVGKIADSQSRAWEPPKFPIAPE